MDDHALNAEASTSYSEAGTFDKNAVDKKTVDKNVVAKNAVGENAVDDETDSCQNEITKANNIGSNSYMFSNEGIYDFLC
ncbi:21026_t:CDS:2 [Dentiscutata erythropus]|uniref:21026_t:CDS:1 n=1 Tax=Dentiscutata erythropus TaxID=1348616 RepID=A0A9N9NIB2_9GLOM|nr:21026_t:CDS:2 [Dentiscutata erythropus]